MKSANKHIKVFVISLLLIAISGCGNHSDVTEKLQQAESLMDSQPDSALLVLQSIDVLDEQDKPKFNMLYTQALDKNHIELTNEKDITAAAEYFLLHHDDRNAMISLYYLARTQYQLGLFSKAITSFFKAKSLAENINDSFWIGMSCRGISDIYNESFNKDEELYYAKQEYKYIKRSSKQPYVNYALLDLARAYCSSAKYEKAIMSARQAIDSAALYNDNNLSYGANQIIGISFFGSEKYAEAERVFKNLYQNEYSQTSDTLYYCICLNENGYNKEADEILQQTSVTDDPLYFCAKYKVSKEFHEYDKAINYLEIMNNGINDTYKNRICHDFTTEIVDYLHLTNKSINAQLNTTRITSILVISVCAFAIIILVITFYAYHKRKQRDIESKVIFAEQLQDLLMEKDVETSKSTEIVKNLMESRNQLLEELCEIVMNSNNSKIARQRIANAVTSIIDNLSVRSEKIEELENQVNDMYDNLFIRFRSDMPNLKEVDYRLYLFLILRISNSAISLFLKEDKINAVYDRKRRLKDKIKKLDKVKSKEYLSYIT